MEEFKSIWSAAGSDSERMKAFTFLMKIINTEITEEQRRDIFETVDLSFLAQLLLFSEQEEYPSDYLKTVSLTILSSFCMDSSILNDSKMSVFIGPIYKVLLENITKGPSASETVVLEALKCLCSMAKRDQYRYFMLNKGMFGTLAKSYCVGSYGQGQTLDLLLSLISYYELQETAANQQAFNMLLEKMSEQFQNENSSKKFELCEKILTIIIKCPSFSITVETANKIREVLTLILRNKLAKEQRDNSIKLASLLVDKLGSSWFAEDSENSKTFFILLAQLSCVEITMLIEDKSASDIIGESFLLTACYTIFEYVISVMVTDGWFQSKRNCVDPLLNSIKMAMTAALSFIKKVASDCTNISFNVHKLSSTEQIILATIRVVCSWLAEETFSLQDKVHEVLPFILIICKEWFRQAQLSEISLEIDPLRFLISPLCHLTADKKSLQILINSNLLNLLLPYFEHNWKRFGKDIETETVLNTICIETETVLNTICSILINIVVLQPHLPADHDEFFTLLKLLVNGMPSIATNSEHLVLTGNFAALGLLLTKHCHKKMKSCETSFYPFLSASIKFLWDAHFVETQEAILCITRKYRDVWADVKENWFLGMHALCSLLPVMPWIVNFIAESGWPVVIIDVLSKVSTSGIDDIVKTYQALLCMLVRISDDVAETLVQNSAIAVCHKHQLSELGGLLFNFVKRKTT